MWDPFRDFRRFDRLMREFWEPETGPKLLTPGEGTMLSANWRTPAVDMMEVDGDIKVTVEIPGIKKEDIKIDVADNQLRIEAESKVEKEEKKKGYLYRERRQGTFFRSLELPSSVDAEKTKAVYKDGILTLTLPRLEKVKAKKVKIE